MLTKQETITVIDRLVWTIEDLIYKGTSNFVIINLGANYYIQLKANRGDLEIYCEAVSNDFLTRDHFLNQEQKQQLLAHNWKLGANPSNYYQHYPVDSEWFRKQLAYLILNTAQQVYGISFINEEDIWMHLDGISD